MTTQYLDRLTERLGARYSQHTIRAYRQQSNKFLSFAGIKPSYSRAEMLAFIDKLIMSGYKGQSIKTILAGVRVMFESNDLTWPIDGRDTHLGLPQEDVDAPTLEPGEVKTLITHIRSTAGWPRIVVALASIYGLRSDEISRALAAGCNGSTLEIQTAKGGRKRTHAIPVQIRPLMTFGPRTVSTRYLHRQFEELMLEHVRDTRPREGWHAVRRTLVTELLQRGQNVRSGDPWHFAVHSWMGWKEIKDISYRYYHPNPIELDRTIYTVHPFLPFWIGGK